MIKLFLSLFILISIQASAQKFKLQTGATYNYHVNAGGMEYEFSAKFSQFKPAAKFSWQMTNDFNNYGSVTIPATALATSKKMYNYFKQGNIILKDETSILLSKAAYKLMAANKPVTLKDGDRSITFTDYGVDGYGIDLNGQYAYHDAIYASDEKRENFITVMQDSATPLILSMKIGFEITLTNVYSSLPKTVDVSAFIGKTITSLEAAPFFNRVAASAYVTAEDDSMYDITETGEIDRSKIIGGNTHYREYSSSLEGIRLNTVNDTITAIVIYPRSFYHDSRQYNAANFTVPQVTNINLSRSAINKSISYKKNADYVDSMDGYTFDNGDIIEFYYQDQYKKAGKWIKIPASKQKLNFIYFERKGK